MKGGLVQKGGTASRSWDRAEEGEREVEKQGRRGEKDRRRWDRVGQGQRMRKCRRGEELRRLQQGHRNDD